MDAVLELEIGPGPEPGTFLVRVLRSAGGGEPTGVIRLDVDELAARRPLLEASVLASAVPARRVLPTTEAALREVGERLFEATFDGEIGATYRTSMAIASERGTGLQLSLSLTAPELATLPWESLFDPHADVYLCRKEPLVRHVSAPYSPPALELTPPLRILAMAASPRGLPLLDVAGERERLEEALHPHVEQGLIELEWLDDASWAGIHAKLLEREWHVLHFIGHGTYDIATDEGMLAFVAPDGRPDLVPANALADLLDEAEPTPRLVVLNSCESGAAGGSDLFSGTAAALAHSGIHAVAAMQFSISDAAAIAFARGFYTALAHGRDVDEAVRSGRIGILGTGRGTLEWVTPVLYLRGDDTRLFSIGRGAVAHESAPEGPSGAAAESSPAPKAVPEPALAAASAGPTDTRAGPVAPHRRRRWVVWAGLGGLVAIAGVIAAIAFLPRGDGGGTLDESSGSGDGDDFGGTVEGIGGTSWTEVVVPLDTQGVNVGVWCAAGDRFDITATGDGWHGGSDATRIGPDGVTDGSLPETRILDSANTASLIGLIEDTDEPPFEVGTGTRYVCPVDGTLFLAINDTSLADNRGEFHVTVAYVPQQ